jgi:hypothetical protein
MNYTLITIVLVLIFYLLFLRFSVKEKFTSDQEITIKTVDNQYAMVCADKSLCLTSDPKIKGSFIVKTFEKNPKVIALSNDGYYVAACFGDKCTDDILVNNYNPYAANTKLTLEANSDGTYYIQFYDGKYMSVGISKNIQKTFNKENALKVYLS